jgi:hypothetical protein
MMGTKANRNQTQRNKTQTPEDGHVGRNTSTIKRKTIYNKAARRRQLNLKTF